MGWPIKTGGTIEPGARPSWKLWALLLGCLAAAGAAWAVWSWPKGKPVDMRFWLRAAITPLLAGCVLLGLRINRHEQSIAASVANEEATEKTKAEWRQWAQRALNVIACAAVTPERDCVVSMTSTPPTAIASPHEGRKFHNWQDDGKTEPLQWAFEQLMRGLDSALPNWHGCVRSIHVQAEFEMASIECAWRDAAFAQERALPVPVRFDANDWERMFDEPDAGPQLFVAVQAWPASREPRQFSELAVALLVSGKDAKGVNSVPTALIGRPMPLTDDTLDTDLAMLCDYCEVESSAMSSAWLTGVPSDFSGTLTQAMSRSDDSEDFVSYPIDHCLGPAHIAQYWFALAAAAQSQRSRPPQLTVARVAKGLIVHLVTGPQATHQLIA